MTAHLSRKMLVAYVVLSAAAVVATVFPVTPVAAVEIPTLADFTREHVASWVDASGRMHAAWPEPGEEGDEDDAPSQVILRIARFTAGTSVLDSTHGSRGIRALSFTSPAFNPDLTSFGRTSDGGFVMVWEGRDVVIDRLDASFARIGRSTTMALSPGRQRQRTLVAANGLVVFQTRGASAEDATTSLESRRVSDGVTLGVVTLPAHLDASPDVLPHGASGLIVNTMLVDGTLRRGPAFVASSASNPAIEVALPAGCGLWPNGGGFFRVCSERDRSAGVEVSSLASDRSVIWQRRIADIGFPEGVVAHSGGRVAMVSRDCVVDVLEPECEQRRSAVRVGASGAVERVDLGREVASDEPIRQVYPPVEMANGVIGVAFRSLFNVRVVAGAPVVRAVSVPGKPVTPRVLAGPSSVSVTWLPPSEGGSTISGYRITPVKDGVDRTTVTVAPETTRLFTGLVNGASYRFRVAAVNQVGVGPVSGLSAAAVPAGAVPAPFEGQADASFGVNGRGWFNYPAEAKFLTDQTFRRARIEVFQQPSGKLIIARMTDDLVRITRVNSDGSADPTFAGGRGPIELTEAGLRPNPIVPTFFEVEDVAVSPNGEIVVAMRLSVAIRRPRVPSAELPADRVEAPQPRR